MRFNIILLRFVFIFIVSAPTWAQWITEAPPASRAFDGRVALGTELFDSLDLLLMGEGKK